MSNIQLQENDTENIIELSNKTNQYDITLTDGQDTSIDVSLFGNDTNVSINILSSKNNTSELRLSDSDAWECAEECRQIKNDISTTLDNIREAGNIKITRNNNSLIIGTKSYLHEQNEPSDIWYIEHDLDKLYVQIRVIDSAGNSYYPAYDFIDKNSCYVYLDGNTTGKAYVE